MRANHSDSLRGIPLPSGILPVAKSRGFISKDVSRWLTRRVGKNRIGHVGTLDPMAEGVLPILIGSATRLQDYLLSYPKSYEFDVDFGISTDTLDTEGKVIDRKSAAHVCSDEIQNVLGNFRGQICQVPPIFSAVKYQGRALYEYARSGKENDVPLEKLERQINVFRLELVSYFAERATFQVSGSKGLYVRSLARDIAQAVGTVGTVSRILRTCASGLEISACQDLELLDHAWKEGKLADYIKSPLEILKDELILSIEDPISVETLLMGQTNRFEKYWFFKSLNHDISNNENSARGTVFLKGPTGQLFGIGTFEPVGPATVHVHLKRQLL